MRKTNNANSMSYRLHGKHSQYMTQDDAASGLKMSEEVQGQQGFAFLMKEYDPDRYFGQRGRIAVGKPCNES